MDDEQNLLGLPDNGSRQAGFCREDHVERNRRIEVSREGCFQLALLDIKMGPVNGVQLFKEIKGRRPIIKVVMMTGLPTSESRMQASENGASAYLTKPVDLQKLVDTINSLTH